MSSCKGGAPTTLRALARRDLSQHQHMQSCRGTTDGDHRHVYGLQLQVTLGMHRSELHNSGEERMPD